MISCCMSIEKFKREPLRSQLINTGDEELVEGNHWCDNYWGDCTCADVKADPGRTC